MKTNWLLFLLCFGLAGIVSAEMRTWTSAADASKTFEAEYRSVEGDIVTLVKADGTVLPVKLEILSDADKEFVKSQMEAEPPAPPEPAPPLSADEIRELEKEPLPKEIKRELVKFERNAVRRVTVDPAKYYLVYHGASFSGPCFKAAPGIGIQYTELIATNPKVEMIYVGHDKEEDQLEEMLAEFGVPIPTVRFGALDEVELIKKHLPDRVTVPIYHLLDSKGELVDSGEGLFEKLKDLE